MPNDDPRSPAIPLSDVADDWLRDLARATRSPGIAALDGATLLGERARLNGFVIPGQRSAGGGCRLIECAPGEWIALNLSRAEDRELMPALFMDARVDPDDLASLAKVAAHHTAAALVERGREMGLAISDIDESHDEAAVDPLIELSPNFSDRPAAPLVLDLSSLWAGPLAGHLLWLAGARVLKVEAPQRPDTMRDGDPALFALLNQGKANVSIDLRSGTGRAQLTRLLARADIVIEAARPRALQQLGIDAEASLHARPGQVWISITAHGARGANGLGVGFGDDCGVAGGLSAAMAHYAGRHGFVGDAIADPLTGIAAARAAWDAYAAYRTCRLAISMRAVCRNALDQKRASDALWLERDLLSWAAAQGRPFPDVTMRLPQAEVRAPGADDAVWLDGGPC